MRTGHMLWPYPRQPWSPSFRGPSFESRWSLPEWDSTSTRCHRRLNEERWDEPTSHQKVLFKKVFCWLLLKVELDSSIHWFQPGNRTGEFFGHRSEKIVDIHRRLCRRCCRCHYWCCRRHYWCCLFCHHCNCGCGCFILFIRLNVKCHILLGKRFGATIDYGHGDFYCLFKCYNLYMSPN